MKIKYKTLHLGLSFRIYRRAQELCIVKDDIVNPEFIKLDIKTFTNLIKNKYNIVRYNPNCYEAFKR